MSINDQPTEPTRDVRETLTGRTKESLVILAKKLRVRHARRLQKEQLIDQILLLPEDAVRKALHITWWDKWHNHVYGIATLIGLVLTVIPFLPRKPANLIDQPTKDVFICHALEDEELIVSSLAERLESAGLTVACKDFQANRGDMLTNITSRGFRECRNGIIIQSSNFFAKGWSRAEIESLQKSGGSRVLFPVLRSISRNDVLKFLPSLPQSLEKATGHGFDEVLAQWNTNNLDVTVEAFLDAIEPASRHKFMGGQVLALTPPSVRLHSGEWKATTPVAIANRSDKRVYSVSLAIIPVKGIPSDSLEVSFAKENDSPVGKVGDSQGSIDWNTAVMQMHCKNEAGREFLVLYVHSIGPKSEFRLLIGGTKPFKSSAELLIGDFQIHPPSLMANTNMLAIPIKPPAIPPFFFRE